MTVSREDSVTVIRKSSSSDESLKTTCKGGFFVSGQEITLDPPDPSIPLIFRRAKPLLLTYVNSRKLQDCNF